MFGNSPTLMADITAIFMEETNLISDAEGLVSSAVFQPITQDMTSHFSKNGGNALGLAGQGPLNRKLRQSYKLPNPIAAPLPSSFFLPTPTDRLSPQHRHLMGQRERRRSRPQRSSDHHPARQRDSICVRSRKPISVSELRFAGPRRLAVL